MKFFLLLIIIILTSCSLNQDSVYWNNDPIKKNIENKKLSKILKRKDKYKTMTFDEFNLYLKDYSNKADYPDLNN